MDRFLVLVGCEGQCPGGVPHTAQAPTAEPDVRGRVLRTQLGIVKENCARECSKNPAITETNKMGYSNTAHKVLFYRIPRGRQCVGADGMRDHLLATIGIQMRLCDD